MGKKLKKECHAPAKRSTSVKLVQNEDEQAITRTVLAALAVQPQEPGTIEEEAAFRKKFGSDFIAKVTRIAGRGKNKSVKAKKKPIRPGKLKK